MEDHEAQRIATAAHALRPDWPASSVLTLIRKNLMSRPRRDVAVALAWIACEPNSATPARVLETGPWWRAAGIEGATARREPYDRNGFCGVCGESEATCRRKWTGDHEYRSRAVELGRHIDTDVAATVEALRAEVVEAKAATSCCCEASPPEFGGNLPDRECPQHGEPKPPTRDPRAEAARDALRKEPA